MLREQEILALGLIFRGEDKLSKAIRERMKEAESIDWEETVVGFFSTINLNNPLDMVPDIRMWSYAFDHPDFPCGGVYNCMVVDENKLELEGVALGGVEWPYPTDPGLFKELI